MKNLNKTCLKKIYLGYYFKCNQENEEEIENRLAKYTLSADEITDEHLALGKQN
ncbi:hypothetical protein SKUN_001358 [Spiroplasma kunkelii CR2-3x]|uniref:Uncharacterized protein n=1 Tax=Spiroplasma kunkelii CR2-3x TaxID=273035 RepID=A0A0K2JI04_SPIKU|nr:hypothetical protein [Spiroplasma kunkelii]ALA98225.1 hypothetical protein SKUN_001358 [Spiroplasma kunkelii CR2-3x]